MTDAAGTTGPEERRKVLVVEGDAALRRLFEAILAHGGHDAVVVADAEAALQAIAAKEFGCMLIGSPVPMRIGRVKSTLLEHVAEVAPDLVSRIIVITTAVTSDPLLRRALRLRVFAIFGKPFDRNLLMETIGHCLSGQRPARRFYAIPPPVVSRICEAEECSDVW